MIDPPKSTELTGAIEALYSTAQNDTKSPYEPPDEWSVEDLRRVANYLEHLKVEVLRAEFQSGSIASPRYLREGMNRREFAPAAIERNKARAAERARILLRNKDSSSCPPGFPSDQELDALERCFERARGDSGGQTRVRRFLMSWLNARNFGGFDLTDCWNLDDSYSGDLRTVLLMVLRGPVGWYPEHYGYQQEIEELCKRYYDAPLISERCLMCAERVEHRCYAKEHERRELEAKMEREREKERERIREEKPYGVCDKCGTTIMQPSGCDWC